LQQPDDPLAVSDKTKSESQLVSREDGEEDKSWQQASYSGSLVEVAARKRAKIFGI
jgi:hypothetical protein